MIKPLVSVVLFVTGEYSFLCVPATQGGGRGTVRRRRYWTVMVRLAQRGMALALSLLVLLSVASPASALCTFQQHRPASQVPLLFVLTQEDQSEQDLRPASPWPGVPALGNVSNDPEHTLPAHRWSIGRAIRVRTLGGVSPYPERAPPA